MTGCRSGAGNAVNKRYKDAQESVEQRRQAHSSLVDIKNKFILLKKKKPP